MARRLRAYDADVSPSAGANNNARVNAFMSRNVQGIRNKRLRKNLKKAEFAYHRQAGFVEAMGTKAKRSSAALKKQRLTWSTRDSSSFSMGRQNTRK